MASNSNALGGGRWSQAYQGTNAKTPPNVWRFPTSPTEFSIQGYALGDIWINTETETVFILLSVAASDSSDGQQVANWAELTTATGTVDEITGDTGTAVPLAGVINFNGNSQSGSTVKFSASTNVVLLDVTDDFGNTLMGDSAGNNSVTGIRNTGIGQGALRSLTSSEGNVAVGYLALTSFQVGTSPTVGDNTAIGTQSMQDCIDGVFNTAVGDTSLATNAHGIRNVAIGSSALQRVEGSDNVAVGTTAAQNLLTGSTNISIGDGSGTQWSTSESSNIAIGSVGVAADNHVIRIGTTGAGSGQQNQCFIAGIDGVNVGSTAKVITLGTAGTADKLGTATIAAGSGITVTPGANTITIAASGSSGAMQLIQTRTASAVTELTFTTGISATYNTYMIVFRSLSEATAANTDAFVQLSTDGGGTYITTGYRNNNTADAGLQITNITDANSLGFGTVYLYNMTSAAGYVSSNTIATMAIPGTSSLSSGANATYETPNITVNAIRIRMADNAAFSGVFSLYSIAE